MTKFAEPKDVKLKPAPLDLFDDPTPPAPPSPPPDPALGWTPIGLHGDGPPRYPYDGQPAWIRGEDKQPVEAVLKQSRQFSRVTGRFETVAFWADRAGRRHVGFTPIEFLPHAEARF